MLFFRSKLSKLVWTAMACTLVLALAACGGPAELPAAEAPMAE